MPSWLQEMKDPGNVSAARAATVVLSAKLQQVSMTTALKEWFDILVNVLINLLAESKMIR